MPHLFVCTGEVSGDLQASHLIRALLQQRPDLQITAVGGEKMAAAGATLLHNTTHISSIGLIEALPFIGVALWTMRRIRRYLQRTRPDVIILVDYIGINSRVAALAQTLGIPAIYYIAPQEWVWQTSRGLSYNLAAQTRLILAIFPAEARHYEVAGGNVRWVGHPLLDILQNAPTREQARLTLGIPAHQTHVVLVPASRPQEVHLILPILLISAHLLSQRIPGIRFSLPLATDRLRPSIERVIHRFQRRSGLTVELLQDPQARACALASADLVLSKSGTVNLETAILGIPQIVIYRLNPLTYWLGKHVLKVRIPFMSPPNLVLMRPVVPELLQKQAQPSVIAQLAQELLQDPRRRAQMHQDYEEVRQKLGSPGVLERASAAILQVLERIPQVGDGKS